MTWRTNKEFRALWDSLNFAKEGIFCEGSHYVVWCKALEKAAAVCTKQRKDHDYTSQAVDACDDCAEAVLELIHKEDNCSNCNGLGYIRTGEDEREQCQECFRKEWP